MIVAGIGVLDIGYVAWISSNYFLQADSWVSLYESFVSFGLPYPQLQIAALIIFYASILICGICMVFNFNKLLWLNYAQFPIRVLLVIPSFYPAFYLLSITNLISSVVVMFILLVITEIARVLVVYKWQHITIHSS